MKTRLNAFTTAGLSRLSGDSSARSKYIHHHSQIIAPFLETSLFKTHNTNPNCNNQILNRLWAKNNIL